MNLNLSKKSKRFRQDAGIALLTTLLLLFLMSSLLVGFAILLASNQRLAGTNNQQVHAFYGAEAGMEQLTAGLGNLFSQTYSPSIGQINQLETTPPNIPGLQFVTGNGTSGYQITPLATDGNGNPAPTITTIKSGNYQGMTAMATEYVLMTNARTPDGKEVTLKRTTQTVGIPMFQFGIFADTDLSFFPGPNFNFGGRTHTNGNLFLAAGSTVWLSDKVDAYKDVIRQTLSNGHPTSAGYTGTVDVTVSPGGGSYRALAANEGSLVGGVGSAGWPGWPNLSMGSSGYNGNLQNGKGSNAPLWAGSAKQLNLGIVTIGSGATQSIDLIRRSYPAEPSNVTAERYFAQASLRVLISDDPSDIMNLPCVDPTTTPFDLSKIAVDPGPAGAGWTAYAPAIALYNRMVGNNIRPLPLAASGAAVGAAAYNSADGYWQPNGFPIIKGFLKIEEQTSYGNPCGTWKDVTVEVLSYGYVGKNIDPVPQSFDGLNLNPQWNGTSANMTTGTVYPNLPFLPPAATNQLSYQNAAKPASGTVIFTGPSTTASGTQTSCVDPHPLAVIRLERFRDNPSSIPYATGAQSGTNQPLKATVAQACGVDPTTGQLAVNWQTGGQWYPQPSDFWPNTLFDTREGTLRDAPMSNAAQPSPTLNGVMQYIEVDGNNLANWFGGKLGNITTSGQSTRDPAVAPNDFLFYVSDRRGNNDKTQTISGWPPLSYTQNETGEYGWNDIVNLNDPSSGCPNNGLDTGEDADNGGPLFTYGANAAWIHAQGSGLLTPLLNGQLGVYNGLTAGGPAAAITPALLCPTIPSYSSGDAIWPMMVATAPNAARENPPMFFRRAVKIVDANNLLGVGLCPSGITCGLSIASENPVYIQGDFNANFGGGGFGGAIGTNFVPTSVAGDAVTLLSVQWNDTNSFFSPYSLAKRAGTTTWYRTAIIGGNTPSFPQPIGQGNDYGTDGGVHNFLRYIETWNGTLEYQGSIVDLYYSRQANGTFKCCNTVYSPPTRGYSFDITFLNPTQLPPRTPLFRDINTTGWARLLLPGQYK